MEDPEYLDFSEQPYEAWIDFLFDRDPQSYASDMLDNMQNLAPIVEKPLVLIDYLRRLCGDLAELTQRYSWKQIDLGLSAALGGGEFWIYLLADSRLPVEPRVQCIRAMKTVFRDVVAQMPAGTAMENSFFMWWDRVCDTLRPHVKSEMDCKLEPFSAKTPQTVEDMKGLLEMLGEHIASGQLPDATQISAMKEQIFRFAPTVGSGIDKQVDQDKLAFQSVRHGEPPDPTISPLIEAAFETLCEILDIDDARCQSSALHGLGHIPHAGAPARVQRYIDEHRSEIPEDGMPWLESCRDGTVL